MRIITVLTLALAMGIAPVVMGQVAKGNIYSTVTDASGAVLPGAVATLTGELGTTTTVSDGTGKFRFLNMDHGDYTIRVELAGFVTQQRDFILTSAVNVDFNFALDIAGVEETITVTAETPVVDIKKTGTEQTITEDELEKIPSSRDPWALLRTVAGVQVDRVNLAGSESGQQSNYQGKGADPDNNTWNIDGVNITDMSAIGASPTYYTYDTFDEVNISTGGADITAPTGGVHMSFVSKRGSNSYRGSFVFNWADDAMQSSNLPGELDGDTRLKGSDKADHTINITDYSIDFGAPIIRDKLWAYGQYGKNVPEVKRLNQSTDKTILKNYLFKVNWQATESDAISYFYFYGAKQKIGRSPGGTLEQTEEHLWDQGGFFPRDPRGLTKLEWNRVWNPNFIMNAKFAYYSTGFTLGARNSDQEIYDYVQGKYFGAPMSWRILRPQTTFRLDNSYFAEQGEGSHEIKFGFTYKTIDQETFSDSGTDKVRAYFNTSTPDEARFYREQWGILKGKYMSLYVGDTYTRGRMNLYGAVRWDWQDSQNAAAVATGNPLVPHLLPDLVFDGGGTGVTWSNISPRFAVTYALDEEFKTVLRASYSRYHGQMPVWMADNDNPLGSRSYMQYSWQDLNSDRNVQVNEVNFDDLRTWGNIDPKNPTALGTPNEVDPDLGADIDHELVFGVDREIVRDLGVGFAFNWRKSNNPYWYPDIGVTSADYHMGEPETTDGYTSIPYLLNDGVTDRESFTGGTIVSNREDYNRRFWGLEFNMNKRLSNKWMSRVTLGYSKQQEFYSGTAGIQNPSYFDTSPSGKDGATFMRLGGGSGQSVWFSYGWTFNATGLYQLPWDMEIAGNIFTRQGYALPYYHRIYLGPLEGTTEVVALEDTADIRLQNLFNLDIRFAKNFMFGDSHRGGTVAFEIFNLFNTNADLARQINLSSPGTWLRLDGIMAPRIARIVAKIRF